MIYELSFRGSGGAVVPGQLSAFEAPGHVTARSMELVNYEQVTFLIHGFNVKGEEGRASLSALAKSLPAAQEGAVVFVLWPGDSPVGPLSYPFTEGNQANDTAMELRRFIENHVALSTKLNFVAHSLGCRVVLESIRNLHRKVRGKRDVYPVNQVCLLAGAVDDYSLSMPEAYKAAVERAERIVVLSSVEDNVLKLIYPLGDLVQSFIFFWKETFGLALGYHGPKKYTSVADYFAEEDEIKVWPVPGNVTTVAIDEKYEVDHGDYLPSADAEPEQKRKQKAAASFVNIVIGGEESVRYTL